MSTLRENPTLISQIGDLENDVVKIEESIISFEENFDKRGSDKEKIRENFNSSVIDINFGNEQSEYNRKKIGSDAISATDLGADTGKLPELPEETSNREETLDEKLLLDIKPTVLEQLHFKKVDTDFIQTKFTSNYKDFLSSKKNIRKKRFSAFLKSFYVLCDICDDQGTQRVIKLNRHERIVAAIILKISSGIGITTKKIIPTKIPEQTCGRCFQKIILFYNLHKNKYTRKKIKQEAGKIMEDQTSHGYQCQCVTCQNQYGALPVLLKGIEEQHKMQSTQPPDNFQPHYNLDISHSQPLVNLQQSVHTVTGENREVNYQQYLVKYEEGYKSLESEMPEHFPSQASVQSYSEFGMPESHIDLDLQSTSSTATYLGHVESDFSGQTLNAADQGQFSVNAQSRSQYYVSESTQCSVEAPAEGSLSSQEHLPTMLQELEDKCRTELANQPSTSSQFHAQDDKQTKKIMTCAHCHKNFTHKGDFNKHLRKHTKEKPYKCSFCDKMFSHTSNLHRHQRIHSGDRPFKCQYCDKCFNRKDKLESHKNSKVCKNKRNWK